MACSVFPSLPLYQNTVGGVSKIRSANTGNILRQTIFFVLLQPLTLEKNVQVQLSTAKKNVFT